MRILLSTALDFLYILIDLFLNILVNTLLLLLYIFIPFHSMISLKKIKIIIIMQPSKILSKSYINTFYSFGGGLFNRIAHKRLIFTLQIVLFRLIQKCSFGGVQLLWHMFDVFRDSLFGFLSENCRLGVDIFLGSRGACRV